MNKKAILVLIVFLSLTGMVFAASGDSMTIGGVVPLFLDLTMVQDNLADDLDLDSDDLAATAIPIAGLTIDTNSSAGWDLVVMSANNSSLKNQVTEAIAYTATYVRTAGTSTSAGALSLTAAGVVLTSDTARTDPVTYETGAIQIAYTRSTSFPAGYYSDLLTVTLRAK